MDPSSLDVVREKSALMKGINWYRAFLLILVLMGPLSSLAVIQWLQLNYVTAESNNVALTRQVGINEQLTTQLINLSALDQVKREKDLAQDKRLDNLEGDVRQQRDALLRRVP